MPGGYPNTNYKKFFKNLEMLENNAKENCWIKTESELPAKGYGYYLVYDGGIKVGWYNKDAYKPWWKTLDGRSTSEPLEGVTHWMPLPKQPK